MSLTAKEILARMKQRALYCEHVSTKEFADGNYENGRAWHDKWSTYEDVIFEMISSELPFWWRQDEWEEIEGILQGRS